MKIHYRNADALLFEKVNSLGEKPNSWRCIHLKLSAKREQYHHALLSYFIIKGIVEILSDDEGHIYLCHDGDIFILFQGALRPMMGKLASNFADIEPTYNIEKHVQDLLAIYDLSKDWPLLFSVCHGRAMQADLWQDDAEHTLHRHTGEALAEVAGEA